MDISRLLIVRTSALGDIVHSLPVLSALRRHLPRTRIGWVVEESFASLLEGHPDIDEILKVRLRQWRHLKKARSTAAEIATFLDRLGKFSAEIVLDLMGNHKAGIISALTLADHRIGLGAAWRREPSSALWISHGVRPHGHHAVERSLSLLGALGLPAERADFGGEKLLAAARDSQGTFIAGRGGRPFALIHPGAGWKNKLYPAALWATAARQLAADIEIFVVTHPGDQAMVDEILTLADGAVQEVSAPTLPDLAALLRAAEIVLGADTGPIHLAHALGTKVLCLMGPTDPARNGPYGCPEMALSIRLPCSPCHKRLDLTPACMSDLEPALVAERARQILLQ